ncbi:MAG TPA: NYN domain-containing protein, partial [Candidatus Paceibacterota bacterium]|nr:NYN domain-containing protein [Candidatus Paceibacterota bacterium]
AVDAIKYSEKVDAIVIASGDGDFVPLAEYLRSHGCQVEAIAFGKSSSQRLRENVDDFIDMDQTPQQFLIGRRGGVSRHRRTVSRVVGADTND